MRPIVRGKRPTDDQGNNIQYKDYRDARGELIDRLGEYCSYCEMHLDSSLAVEHVQPKQPASTSQVDQERNLNWDNFLLACVNCNSTKGDTKVDLDEYFWPDRDNTFRALKYSEGGLISPSLVGDLKRKAENTIKLTGLHKNPQNDPSASDRRWLNRKYRWDGAKRAKENLREKDTSQMREVITMWAVDSGYWSIWMTVFQDDPDMCQRLISAFNGTCSSCFDTRSSFVSLEREGGLC